MGKGFQVRRLFAGLKIEGFLTGAAKDKMNFNPGAS
jgi:hypothetical protein